MVWSTSRGIRSGDYTPGQASLGHDQSWGGAVEAPVQYGPTPQRLRWSPPGSRDGKTSRLVPWNAPASWTSDGSRCNIGCRTALRGTSAPQRGATRPRPAHDRQSPLAPNTHEEGRRRRAHRAVVHAHGRGPHVACTTKSQRPQAVPVASSRPKAPKSKEGPERLLGALEAPQRPPR